MDDIDVRFSISGCQNKTIGSREVENKRNCCELHDSFEQDFQVWEQRLKETAILFLLSKEIGSAEAKKIAVKWRVRD